MLDAGLCIKLVTFIGGCVAVPLITTTLIEKELTTQTESEIVTVTEKGETIGPIFDCDNNQSNYKVYLVPNADKLSKSTELDSNINLQIVEKEGNKSEQIVWGAKDTENKWTQWDIHILSGITVQLFPSVFGVEGFGQAANCSSSKVSLKQGQSYGKFWSVKNKSVNERAKFKVDSQTCPSNKAGECSIVFAEDSPFEWNSGFQPKVTIPLEKR